MHINAKNARDQRLTKASFPVIAKTGSQLAASACI